ncbi:MAG TPA: DUF5011 domain-containing protein, partial [bacterium]|nr:DUF5011 domain-containing protein [bacterium]
SKTWNWDSDDENATYRYAINQNATHEFTVEEYSSTKTTTQSSGDGIYYLHVQAKDGVNNESTVIQVSAVLDNTPPTITGLSNDSTPRQSKTWIWSSDDENATYRYHVTTTDSFIFSDEEYSTTTSTTQSSGDGIYYLHVQAKDMADNTSTSTVSAVLDNTSPTITILGSNPEYTFINESYTDSGATASDETDGDITSSIVITNTVDTSTIGTYYVTYVVSDTALNSSTSTRTVNVINLPPGSVIPTYILESMNQQNQVSQEREENNNNNQEPNKGEALIQISGGGFGSGSFIKANNIKTVYFLDKNNIRYIYPSESVWKSYFGKDFSNIEVLNNNQNISNYKLGKNVLFKKGTLFKIPSVKKVYLVAENGLIQWIKTEAKAIELYGKDWKNLVYDLSEAFFGDYTEGVVIE